MKSTIRSFANALKHNIKGDYAVDLFNPHLGGYKHGGDHYTDHHWIFDYFFQKHMCSSSLDVGCAEGRDVRYMLDLGYDAYGIEGVKKTAQYCTCPDRVTYHDLTVSPLLMDRKYDLVYCCEVVEHIEERFSGNVILTLVGNCEKYLVMTYAPPGSGGYHHVNCQPAEYWIRLITSVGMEFEKDLTQDLRNLVANEAKEFRHFTRSGLIFSRR